MTPAWARLLDESEQPPSLRDCYELVSRFVEDLSAPTPLKASELGGPAGSRAGYLTAAARLLAGVQVHPTWTDLEAELRGRARGPSNVALFAADARANSFDELALQWGLTKGVDAAKLQQIVEHGAC